jgi:RNA polymerase sigma-70 factor (ECF subfamily)
VKLVSPPSSIPREPLGFEAVYDAEWQHVALWLQRLGVREEDLSDLTQEVFVRALRAWDRCDFTRPIRPWLFGIAYRVVMGFRRLAHQRYEVIGGGESASPPEAVPGGEEAVTQGERRRLFLRALEGMNIYRRAVFVLYEIEGYTAPEIAEALGEPLNTVYSRLRTARQEFIEAIRRLHGSEEPDV